MSEGEGLDSWGAYMASLEICHIRSQDDESDIHGCHYLMS